MTLNDFLPFNTTANNFLSYLPQPISDLYEDSFPDDIGKFLTTTLRLRYGKRLLDDFVVEYSIVNEYPDFSELTVENYTQILSEFLTPLQDKYIKLWENVVSQTYVPLDNFNGLTETETTYGKTNTLEHTENENNVINSSETVSSIKGFNSSDYNDTDKSNNTGSSNLSKSTSDTDTNSGKDTFTEHKHGNLGVTTSQQMLNSEIAFRQWVFFNELLKDIAECFTIPMYE